MARKLSSKMPYGSLSGMAAGGRSLALTSTRSPQGRAYAAGKLKLERKIAKQGGVEGAKAQAYIGGYRATRQRRVPAGSPRGGQFAGKGGR